MKCPKCDGYMWTEQERAGDYEECLRQYGVDVVCIAGHRTKLTLDDYKKYKEAKNATRKIRCN